MQTEIVWHELHQRKQLKNQNQQAPIFVTQTNTQANNQHCPCHAVTAANVSQTSQQLWLIHLSTT